jgi:hypothetical protein
MELVCGRSGIGRHYLSLMLQDFVRAVIGAAAARPLATTDRPMDGPSSFASRPWSKMPAHCLASSVVGNHRVRVCTRHMVDGQGQQQQQQQPPLQQQGGQHVNMIAATRRVPGKADPEIHKPPTSGNFADALASAIDVPTLILLDERFCYWNGLHAASSTVRSFADAQDHDDEADHHHHRHRGGLIATAACW